MEEGGGSEAIGENRAWGNLVREEDFRNKERECIPEKERERERARAREECLHTKQGSGAMKAQLFFFPPFLSFSSDLYSHSLLPTSLTPGLPESWRQICFIPIQSL